MSYRCNDPILQLIHQKSAQKEDIKSLEASGFQTFTESWL